jgi:hypothetical protein
MQLYPPNIFICGEICSGKDFLASVLAKEFGYRVMNIGHLIAAELEQLNGLKPGTIYSSAAIKSAWRGRLQAHGNARRAERPDYWAHAWWVKRNETPDEKLINASCRFPVEVTDEAQRSAFIVRVLTPRTVRWQRALDLYPGIKPEVFNDPSDASIDEVPFHAYLPGTLPLVDIKDTFSRAFNVWHDAGRPVLKLANIKEQA